MRSGPAENRRWPPVSYTTSRGTIQFSVSTGLDGLEGGYQAAISDPELRRTKVELEDALSDASEARQVVFELFQDLESFSLE